MLHGLEEIAGRPGMTLSDRSAHAAIADLVGVAEIAELLGVTRQRVDAITRRSAERPVDLLMRSVPDATRDRA